MIEKTRGLLFKIFKPGTFFGKLVDKLFTKEIVLYVIFGVLTTAVNLATFALVNKLFDAIGWEGILSGLFSGAGMQKALELLGNEGTAYLDSTAIAWTVAVIFAFVTNKLVVFESKSWKAGVAGKEFVAFIGARLFSLLVELMMMFLMVSVAGMNKMIAKIIVQIVVVILNYVFSKLFIFKDKNKGDS